MFEIKNGVIKLTQGDSFGIDVDLYNRDGTHYEMQVGDELYMTVREKPWTDEVLEISTSTPEISCNPATTRKLKAGRYCCDIKLKTAKGAVHTIFGVTEEKPYNMIVYPEITKQELKI